MVATISMTTNNPSNQLLESTSHGSDLVRRVRNFLAARQYSSLRQLSVEAQGGEVTLRGQVGSYYEKQLSLLLSSRVAGVTRLIDEIAVNESTNH
jgi:osmotically-inducible protein OsmY